MKYILLLIIPVLLFSGCGIQEEPKKETMDEVYKVQNDYKICSGTACTPSYFYTPRLSEAFESLFDRVESIEKNNGYVKIPYKYKDDYVCYGEESKEKDNCMSYGIFNEKEALQLIIDYLDLKYVPEQNNITKEYITI